MAHHIIVTGASTGIGLATVARLQSAGLHVTGTVRTPEDAARVQSATGCHTVICDVTDTGSVATAMAEVSGRVEKGDRLSLVNNAGIAVAGPVEHVPVEDFSHQFDVNVIGLVRVTQLLLPTIRATCGRIINMSSISGRIASPFLAPYAASKHAVEAITDSLRREMEPFGVKVVSINPGIIRTPIWEKSAAPIEDRYLSDANREIDPYRDRLVMLNDMVQKSAARGTDADQVAQAIEHALVAARPKTRYFVGRKVGRTAFLARLLPDRAIDRMATARFRR